jgi:site-specific recombinase XerD
MGSVRKITSKHAPGVVLRVQHGKRGDHLFLDIHAFGTRKREFLRLYLTGDDDADRSTLLKAEEIRTLRLQQMHASRYGIESSQYAWDADFIAYFAALTADRSKNWRSTLAHLRRFTKDVVRFSEVNENWIEKFIRYLRGQELHHNSVNVYTDTLKAALNLAVRERRIPRNPFGGIPVLPRKHTQRTFLTFAELQLLLITPCRHTEVRRAFLFACYTGLRLSDLRALTWSCVHADGLHFTQRKTGDYNHIPLAHQARAILGTHPSLQGAQAESTRVFTLPGSDDTFNRYLKEWVAKAGISKCVTSHVARHTFATLLVSSNANLYTVQHLLGHRDIRVTQVYARLLHDQKERAIAALPSLTPLQSPDQSVLQLPLITD